MVRRALELSATALILVLNHPSGDPTPSATDIRMTREIMDVAKPLGITVHDHIIVDREGHASLKGLRLIGAATSLPLERDLPLRFRLDVRRA